MRSRWDFQRAHGTFLLRSLRPRGFPSSARVAPWEWSRSRHLKAMLVLTLENCCDSILEGPCWNLAYPWRPLLVLGMSLSISQMLCYQASRVLATVYAPSCYGTSWQSAWLCDGSVTPLTCRSLWSPTWSNHLLFRWRSGAWQSAFSFWAFAILIDAASRWFLARDCSRPICS